MIIHCNRLTMRRLAGPFLALLIAGCASAPPPQPKSDLRIQADRAAADGAEEYGRRNWPSAALMFQRAGEIYAALDDFSSQAAALHNQAQSLRKADRVEAAVEAYSQALAINQKEGLKSQQAENLAGSAQCAAVQGKLEEAIATLEKALELAANSPSVRATVQNDLALLLLQQDKTSHQDRVLELLRSALQLSSAKRPTSHQAVTQLNLGRACVAYTQLEEAEKHLGAALAQFRELDDPLGLAHTHEAMAHLALASDDREQATVQFQLAREKYAFLKDEEALRRLDAAQ